MPATEREVLSVPLQRPSALARGAGGQEGAALSLPPASAAGRKRKNRCSGEGFELHVGRYYGSSKRCELSRNVSKCIGGIGGFDGCDDAPAPSHLFNVE